MEVIGKPKKCWFCAKLGKCTILEPCKDFVKYNYRTGRPVTKPKKPKQKSLTWSKVAELLGISRQSVYQQLKATPSLLLAKLQAATGKHYEYKKAEGKYKKLYQIDE